ncbi:MAG: right-handed parallel beta-helix repeat-containing protein [Gammaproteobacteria bacterium]|nr:right-handed parallel beta-helix repeat-containing protein [Gammaproteobacteria bacterium]NNJ85342.1 hypothetical protein [Gammaproteobacteria bacterium]
MRKIIHLLFLSFFAIGYISPAMAAGSRGDYNPPPATGTHYVKPRAPNGGDGSSEHPFNALQHALCVLRPGDRLVMRVGDYGPVSVAGDCVDGTAERPITVVADQSAALTGKAPEVPVLDIQRAFWRFEQLEIMPDRRGPIAVRIQGKETHHIEIVDAHIHKGGGNGISISDGAHDITIQGTHIHHIGDPRGEKARFHAAALLLTPDVRGVLLTGSDVHHIRGEHPFQLVGTEDEGIRAPSSEQMTIIESQIPTGHQAW